ncbi:hypothetical protein EOM09_06750, partial [bacterium]|nr:hypothetical protein [bacterium]
MTILIINMIQEENSLHENEFLNPIIDIIEKTKIDFKIIHYLKLNEISIENYEKIILSGTSLKDNEYLNHIDKFQKLKEYKNFILAICAGAQIIAKIHNAKIKKGKEIGLMETILVKENQILNLVPINQRYT